MMIESDSKTMKIYLREIGQTDLLTPQQEIELAARIKKGDAEARSLMIRERTTQKISEAIRRRLRRGVSVSFKASADGAADWAAAFLGLAP